MGRHRKKLRTEDKQNRQLCNIAMSFKQGFEKRKQFCCTLLLSFRSTYVRHTIRNGYNSQAYNQLFSAYHLVQQNIPLHSPELAESA